MSKPPPSPKPQPSFSVLGTRPTGKFRFRGRLILWPSIERLWEKSDGSAFWKKIGWMETVEFRFKEHE